jgi:hypothetical protein
MHIIKKNGMIWVSWCRKSSGKSTEIAEDIIRDTALAIGLVDVKGCAVNDSWSGLKLGLSTSFSDIPHVSSV